MGAGPIPQVTNSIICDQFTVRETLQPESKDGNQASSGIPPATGLLCPVPTQTLLVHPDDYKAT